MPPNSPYSQYWAMQTLPEDTRNTLHWRALVSMRSAAQAGGYASDRATRTQRWWEWLRWLRDTGRLSDFVGIGATAG